MKPRIEHLEEFRLVGHKIKMSFARNLTRSLWQGFMPGLREIAAASKDLYSVEVFGDVRFFDHFDASKEFEKWAAVKVNDFEGIPDGMESLVIPSGAYAVFPYKGKPSEAQPTYEYIHAQWIPTSEYELDNRPHFAVMGEKYKGEDPESEEELWVPIRKK